MSRPAFPRTQADALLARARRLLHDHRTRARKDGQVLDYTLADLRELLVASPLCCYCRAPLSFAVSLDHATPVARGGKHSRGNLAVCCPRCQLVKGVLDAGEYAALLACLDTMHPVAKLDVERRLIAGGKRYAAPRGRRKDAGGAAWGGAAAGG